MRAHGRRSGASTVHRGSLLACGLTGWWLTDPLTSGGGTRWVDMLRGRPLTMTGIAVPATTTSGLGASSRPGGLGTAMRFDGTDDQGSVGVPMSTLVTAAACTIACWVRLGAAPVDAADVWLLPALISDSANGYLGIYYGSVDAGTPRLWVYTWAVSDRKVGYTGYTIGKWTHIILSHGGGAIEITIDGTPIGAVAAPDTDNLTGTVLVGMATARFAGELDDIRFYNRWLSPPERMLLYQDSLQHCVRLLPAGRRLAAVAAALAGGQPVGAMLRMGIGR